MCRIGGYVLSAAWVIALLLGANAAYSDEAASTAEPVGIERSALVQQIPGGEIDWGKQMMYAWAEAPLASADTEPNRGRAYLRAKDYAKMEAIARLLMVVEGMTVTYQGVGKDLMDADAGLRRTIEGYVKNVGILSAEKVELDGVEAVRVTVGTPIYGQSTPGAALLGKLSQTEKSKQPPLIEIPDEISVRVQVRVETRGSRPCSIASSRPVDVTAEAPAAVGHGPYTSLVVDARGFVVPQALSPKIRKLNGDQIYGSLLPKSDPALRDGIVSYAKNPEAARECEKCGDNPLVVRAIGRGGGRSMCDVMVSDKTADLILQENRAAGFLEARRVIFVIDPPRSGLPRTVGATASFVSDERDHT